MDDNTLYWVWLTQRPRIGVKGLRQLLRSFGSPAELYAADAETLSRAGLSPALQRALLDKELSPARAVLERCAQEGIRLLSARDPGYPSRLSLAEEAPLLLYCRGKLPREDRPGIALVGARKADGTGLALARRLGREIALCGGLVITGMARGIDSQSALGALEAGGIVVGVLGCGPDVVYPRENRELFDRVAEKGCLISEYPPGTAPNARHFPVRNRIISALSDGVAVIRAAEQSGSLITARWAVLQGRDVYAVPGAPDDPLSRGCNALLREGAYAAESGWDLLRRYEFRYPGAVRMYTEKHEAQNEDETLSPPSPAPGKGEASSKAAEAPSRRELDFSALSPIQRQIVEALAQGPMQADALIDKTGLPAAQVLSQLTLLQIKRVVIQKPGKLYEL